MADRASSESARTAGAERVVHVYRDSRRLAAAVADYARVAFERGRAVLLVMTAIHRELTERTLRRSGQDVDELVRGGQLLFVDARAALAALLDGDLPDGEKFQRLIGRRIASAKERFVGVSAFGEMVDVARGRGAMPAALRLEELWNETMAAEQVELMLGLRATAGSGLVPAELISGATRVVRDLSSRERLMQAACEVFSSAGFDAATTAEIARRAGTSESQLVKHFGHKSSLLQAVLDDWWSRFLGRVSTSKLGGGPPGERLILIFELLLDALREDEAAARLLLFEGRRLRQPERALGGSDSFRRLTETIDGILSELATRGRLPSGLSVQTVRAALIGAFEGMARSPVLASLTAQPEAYALEEVRPSFRALVNALLGSPPAV